MDDDRRLEEQMQRLRRQQGAIVALARRQTAIAGDLDACLREITWVAAVTLRVQRASVWLLSEDRQTLRCLSLYELDKHTHSSGVLLRATDYPGYFAALESGRAIDAHDARVDARTNEFTEGYLEPLGITSMMDAAIRDEGRVIGVVCHEHIGPIREWTADEVAFAGAVADQAALALAAAERHRLEAERDKIRSQLLQVQKLESLGVLAGGLAHDFDRLLTILRGNLSVCRSDPERAAKALEAATAAADRAADLTRHLLVYSGTRRVVVEQVDLGAQLGDIAALASVGVWQRVSVDIECPEGLPTIRGDASQIQQLMMNLVMNAAEAMGERAGQVKVRLDRCDVDEAERDALLFADMLEPGPCVRLQVIDNGDGIDVTEVLQLFDPLHTTKGAGRGLGLASVAGIVTNHGGGLRVESQPGNTVFSVYFPICPPVHAEDEPQAPHGSMVLVIDDEPAIVDVTQQVLADAGYAVAAASTVRDGIALFARYKTQVSAVLVDLRLPEISGLEVLDELRRLRPDVAAILMSGWDAQASIQKYVDQGNAYFMAKPFTIEQLLEVVGRAVATNTPSQRHPRRVTTH
ncbi:MAG TPA: response regulator [Polyangiaceae bacterium]|nr:response regulator [Polyangiaceae bacterium]